ncbi:MAG: hypothetical protein E6J26_07615 [Chloroflexi bacterium]|nr:MAG: hypothetical protein E6J26_07615 [Chloroflexota bacterium]
MFVLDQIPQRPPLYLLLESLNADDGLYASIGAACAAAYKTSRASLTGALLAVSRAASEALRETQPAGAPACGLSALIVNGGEALLAQVEPAACWMLHEGKLLRYPHESCGPARARRAGVDAHRAAARRLAAAWHNVHRASRG